jgi:hypothetical protein
VVQHMRETEGEAKGSLRESASSYKRSCASQIAHWCKQLQKGTNYRKQELYTGQQSALDCDPREKETNQMILETTLIQCYKADPGQSTERSSPEPNGIAETGAKDLSPHVSR